MDNPFKNFFSHSDTNVIGLDIGSSAIKVVQLTKVKGKAILKTYGSIALGPYANLSIGQATNLQPDVLSSIIRDLLIEANVTTRNAGVAIPVRSSLVTLVEMPAGLQESKLQEMIPIEARKYIPVPISEVALDWWIIPEEEDKAFDFEVFNNQVKKKKDKIEVLVVSIHNEILNSYNTIVNGAGLSTSFFEIEMFAAIRALVDREVSSVMIFDMGAAVTKLYIVERGIIKKSHVITKGSQDITLSIAQGFQVTPEKAEKIKRNLNSLSEEDVKGIYEIIGLTLDYIFSETNTVMLSYEKKYNKSIGKVILTGGGVSMKGFFDVAKSQFHTEVVVGDPFAKVETPAFLADMLKVAGLDFGVAVGLALRKLQELG